MADAAAGRRRRSTMRALLVPADPTLPVSVIDLREQGRSLDRLQREVGGTVDVVGHAEGDLWVNDEGRLLDLPVNVRISHWILNDSELSKTGVVGEWSVLYGDIVVTGGPDRDGELTPVSDEMVKAFQSMQLDPRALDDWTTRDIQVEVLDWPELDERGEQGFDW